LEGTNEETFHDLCMLLRDGWPRSDLRGRPFSFWRCAATDLSHDVAPVTPVNCSFTVTTVFSLTDRRRASAFSDSDELARPLALAAHFGVGSW
jgi:hypothetical protein